MSFKHLPLFIIGIGSKLSYSHKRLKCVAVISAYLNGISAVLIIFMILTREREIYTYLNKPQEEAYLKANQI
jgi:type IV secretory pathway component VirB8